jgi:hypothetical protein
VNVTVVIKYVVLGILIGTGHLIIDGWRCWCAMTQFAKEVFAASDAKMRNIRGAASSMAALSLK